MNEKDLEFEEIKDDDSTFQEFKPFLQIMSKLKDLYDKGER